MSGSILARRDRVSLGSGFDLRLLSALELLQARQEGAALAADRRERALCDNACLLARALEKTEDHSPLFPDGRAVLAGLTAEEIGTLAARWGAFRRESDPGLEDLCLRCRSSAVEERCPVCGERRSREERSNPAFDMERFLELRGGSGAD